MLHEFFKDFVKKFNIKNGELASQKKLNASVNVLKKETDDLYNRSEIIRGKLALAWQSQTEYEAGEIVSFGNKNYIVIPGQTSINEIPSESYKWKETVRADWTLDLDPNGYISKDNTKPYMPTGPYNPAVKKYVDDGDEIVYINQDKSNSINFLPLNDTGLANIDYITGNGLPETDSEYVPTYTPTANWHPANKLYVDTQINELADGGSVTIGRTLNSDALGKRSADKYLTLYRDYSGNYNGFAVKNGPLENDYNSTDWLRVTANGLLPYKPFDASTNDGSSLGNEIWKFKSIYGQNGYIDNITSANGNITNLTVDTLTALKFKIQNLNMPIISAKTANIDNMNADVITASTINGTISNAAKLNELDSTQFVRSDVIGTDVSGTLNMKADDQIKFSFYNTMNYRSSEIRFNSYINYGSDYGYIRYDDNNNTYDKWGNSENSSLVLGVRGTEQNFNSSSLALESRAGIFLNAPDVYIGDKYGSRITSVADFVSSKATNGFQKLPDGLIIQWGNQVRKTDSNGMNIYTFPIAFPNSCFSVSCVDDSDVCVVYGVTTMDTDKFVVKIKTSNGNVQTNKDTGCRFIAIGY